MKQFETTETVPSSHGFLVRADGKCFSQYTKGLKKPFDDRFAQAMISTAQELLKYFHPRTVFVCSDEITLVFPPVDDPESQQHIYGGRRFKIETLVASKASVCFNRHMLNEIRKDESDCDLPSNVQDQIAEMDAIFDARLTSYGPDQLPEMANNLIWRSVYDCYRNTVSTYARHYFGHKAIMHKKVPEMIEMMNTNGFKWGSGYYRYGGFVKSFLNKRVTTDGKPYTRTSSAIFTVILTELEPDARLDLLFSKIFDPDMLQQIKFRKI